MTDRLVVFSLLSLLGLCGLAPNAAVAAPTELTILLDTDNDTASGCTVSTVDGPFPGVEAKVVTEVDNTVDPPVVLQVVVQYCTDPGTDTFGAPQVVATGPWPVAVGLGDFGEDAVETLVPPDLLAGHPLVRVGFTSHADEGDDALILGPSSEPILLALAVPPPPPGTAGAAPVPALAPLGLALLSLLLAAVVIRYAGRRGSGHLLVIVLIGAGIGVVWAAGADGDLSDWVGVPPLAEDNVGDSASEADIVRVYFQPQNGMYVFRFDITKIAPSNIPPTLDPIADPTAILEDAGPQVINLSGIGAGGAESQPLEITATSDNTALIPNPSVTYTSPASTGSLGYTPVADASGSALITVTVMDGGPDNSLATPGDNASTVQTFTVTVTAVNDVPSFSAANPPAVAESSPAQTVVGWVTSFSPGPADESGQTVQYLVSNVSAPAAFSSAPAVAANGDLSYALALGFAGPVTFDVAIQDDGGTANGGVDTSAAQTFTLTVIAVDDPPVAVNDTATVTEDDPATTIDVLANDTDPDGGPISITGVVQPTNGTVVITNGGADLTYQPDPNYCNDGTPTDDFTYTLTPGGSVGTVQVTVTCVPDPPTVVDDAYTTVGNTELTVAAATPTSLARVVDTTGLLANDSDPIELGTLSVVALGADTTAPFTGTSTQGGDVSINADGSFVYVPPRGIKNLIDTFTYTAGNTAGAQAQGTVSIQITNDRVWYVHNDPANEPLNPVDGAAAGRSGDPFDTLAQADFNNALSGPGDFIFVFPGDGTTAGMTAGIELTDNQKLVGHQAATLTVGTVTVQTPGPGSRPKIDNTVGGAGVRVADKTGVDIRYLEITGDTHGVDLTATSDKRTLLIADSLLIGNTTSYGFRADSSGTADLEVAFLNNAVESGDTATHAFAGASFTGASLTPGSGTLTITGFTTPSVSPTAGAVGAGIRADTVTFDADTGAADFQPVAATSLTVGDNGGNARAQGAGLDLVNVQGNLSLGTVDIFNSLGTGLHASGTGTLAADSGFGLTIGSGSIDTEAAPAFVVDPLTLATTLTRVVSTGSGTSGISITGAEGIFTAGPTSAISNAAGTSFNVNGGTPTIIYNGTITHTTDNSRAVAIQGMLDGSAAFGGAVSATDGTGILVNGNGGTSSIAFNGAVDLGTSGSRLTDGDAFTMSGNSAGTTITAADVDIFTNGRQGFVASGSGTADLNALSLDTTGNGGRALNLAGIHSLVDVDSMTCSNNSDCVTLSGLAASSTTTVAGVGLTCTGGTCFSASSAQTVEVTGNGNTISATGAVGVNLTSTTVGAGNVTFRSISASGAANGIVLSNTGATGAFNVTGTGAAGTGGTIQNIANRGVSVANAQNVSLSYLNLTDAATVNGVDPTNANGTCGGLTLGGNLGCNASVHLESASNVTLETLNILRSAQIGINVNSVTGLAIRNSTVTDAGDQTNEFSLKFLNLLGTSEITNTTVRRTSAHSAGTEVDNARIQNTTGTLNLTVSGSTFDTDTPQGTPFENNGFVAVGHNSALMNLTVTNSNFNNNKGSGFTAGVNDTASNAQVTVDVSGGNAMNNNVGLEAIANGTAATVDFDFNGITQVSGNPAVGINVDMNSSSGAGVTLRGHVRNNGNISHSGAGDSIQVNVRGAGSSIIAITNNTIDETGFERAIDVSKQEGSGDLDVTITGNALTTDGSNFLIRAMNINSGVLAGDSGTTCAHISGNTLTAGSDVDGLRVRQRANTTFELQGVTGPYPASSATAAAHITAQNTNFTGQATNDATGSAGFNDGTCAVPP